MIPLCMALSGLLHFLVHLVLYAASGQVFTSDMADIAWFLLVPPVISSVLTRVIPVRHSGMQFVVALTLFLVSAYCVMLTHALVFDEGVASSSLLLLTLIFAWPTAALFSILSAGSALSYFMLKRSGRIRQLPPRPDFS